ncbi:glycosyltransferase [Arthrobacter phage DanielleIgnace]|nr:glycosyltransferase [Arthrobacter phage DanielleIgnace]
MLLHAPFNRYTGYGNDGVDMAVQFEKMGVDVVPLPTQIAPGLPQEFTDLLTKTPEGSFDMEVMFGPPFDIDPAKFTGEARVQVGWSMWERTPLRRADFHWHGWEDLQDRERFWGKSRKPVTSRRKDHLDLMVVTCPDNVDAFQALDDGVPYAVVPNGIDPERWPVLDRSWDRPFTFASVGVLNGRKDPFATIDAWKLAKIMDPDFDARLIMKTVGPGLHPKLADVVPDLVIINEVWSQEDLLGFYSQVDCYVSTSRGEGNNKPAMEFMSTGGPVMAPMWGGHVNWLHPDSGYVLPGELVEDPLTGTSDYRVSIEATALTFLDVWRDREGARRKGAVAADRIRADLSWEKVCERFLRSVTRVM